MVEGRERKAKTYGSGKDLRDGLVDCQEELGRFLSLGLGLGACHEESTLIFGQTLFEVVDALAKGSRFGLGLFVDLGR
jgi:hypothetical protein